MSAGEKSRGEKSQAEKSRAGPLLADYAYIVRARLRYWRYGSQPPQPLPAAPGAPSPVLLIPGVFETWHYMKALRDRLSERGHPVHSVPELGFNRHPIAEMAALLTAYLEHRQLTGVTIVAHSKGGLIGKAMLVEDERTAAGRINRMVSINTPYAGIALARFGVGPWREFAPTRPVIVELAAAKRVNRRITSLRSRYDQYLPAGSAVLDGAENIVLPHSGHFRVLGLPGVIEEVVARVPRPASSA
jgi:pimeloyl-ACP methyl ester carboxylesterase